MKLGVFDSGIGGEAIAKSLRGAFPDATVLYVHDSAHMPYGSRTATDVIALTNTAVQPLLEQDCDCIVIACNTATTLAISYLREHYPSHKFIGIEPMIKPAALATKTNVIAVCATPATLESDRYHALLLQYAHGKTIIEPDCSEWAYMIEKNEIDTEKIEVQINNCIAEGADVVVLGCTHYHWIKEMIESLAHGKALVLEPSEAIARQVSKLLS